MNISSVHTITSALSAAGVSKRSTAIGRFRHAASAMFSSNGAEPLLQRRANRSFADAARYFAVEKTGAPIAVVERRGLVVGRMTPRNHEESEECRSVPPSPSKPCLIPALV